MLDLFLFSIRIIETLYLVCVEGGIFMKTFLWIIGALLVASALVTLFVFVLSFVASVLVAVATFVAICAVLYFGYKLINKAVAHS